MRTARKGAFALCAVALAIAALMTFAVPSAAYADGSWTYNSDAHTLTSSSGVTLNNVTAKNSALTIGNNTNRDDLGPSLDLQGEIGGGYTITAIEDYAFYGCTSLTSVTIPAGVETIGDYAFSGCTSLESVEIHDGVKTIGDRAFYGCTSLESVTIPASVETIEVYAFSDCSSLTSICVDGDNGKYSSKEGVLFSDGGETLVRFPGRRGGQYKIPDNVTAIGNHAFDGCSFLTSVEIPDDVKTIGDSAFAGCSSLTSVTIPNGVTAIGDFAFSGCISLKSVTIPDSVTAIGGSAFYSCSSLTSMTIPSRVTAIESSAFNSCSSLESVEIPASVTAIGYHAFAYCSSLESICVDGGNESYSSEDGVLFSDGGETLVCFPGGRGGQYEIPSSVGTIRADAFSGCSSLGSVTIPDGVETIENFAFSGCISLKSVTIPASVTSIGVSAFNSCSSLERVTVLAKKPPTLEYNAFVDCPPRPDDHRPRGLPRNVQ